MSDEKVNKGVLVTTGSFTKGAKEFTERNNIELIDGDALVLLLNEHLGSNWLLHLERLINESELMRSSAP